MKNNDKELVTPEKKDIGRGGLTLARAFAADPVWEKFAKGVDTKAMGLFFEGSIKYGLKYGKVCSCSENMEGVAVWVDSRYSEITPVRMILSGMLKSVFAVNIRRMMETMSFFAPLKKEKEKHMNGEDYLYLMIIGIAPEFQGKGYGNRILSQLISESEQSGRPIYLETSTLANVRFYEKRGFELLSQIVLPGLNLPQWCMRRDIKT